LIFERPVERLAARVPVAESTFRSGFLEPASYLVRTETIPGWTLAAALVNGVDASREPVVLASGDYIASIVLRKGTTSITGVVAGVPDTAAVRVLLFPVSGCPHASSCHEIWPRSRDGAFNSGPILAGEYFVIAVSDGAIPHDWREPESLDVLSRQASRVRITPGGSSAVSLSPRDVR